jgi:hypothetical protein
VEPEQTDETEAFAVAAEGLMVPAYRWLAARYLETATAFELLGARDLAEQLSTGLDDVAAELVVSLVDAELERRAS